MNSMQVLDTALAEMKSKLSLIPNLTSRFLTIGFSQNHDAVFLNKITKSGSELGNFFFIDTSKNDYTEEVKKCLSESLDIAMEGGNNATRECDNCSRIVKRVIFHCERGKIRKVIEEGYGGSG